MISSESSIPTSRGTARGCTTLATSRRARGCRSTSAAPPSLEVQSPNSWRIVRDPLGINKLFWAAAEDGRVAVASRPKRLLEEGFAFSSVRAIPRGSIIELAESRPEPDVYRMPWRAEDPGDRPGRARRTDPIDARPLPGALVQAHKGAEFFVCLSGGLDSSGIAAIRRVPDQGGELRSRPQDGESDDRRVARRLADDLGLPLICVTTPPMSLLEKLDFVLEEGVDWRDFNVHAGLVNAAIAEAIAGSDGNTPKIVLTGDLANEFLADYGEERYRGATYYGLPRLRGPYSEMHLSADSIHRIEGRGLPRGEHRLCSRPRSRSTCLSLPRSLLESPSG